MKILGGFGFAVLVVLASSSASYALDLPFVTRDDLTVSPTQETGRPFRNGVQSSVLAPKNTCPGVSAAPTAFAYHAYTFTNSASHAIGVSVDLTPLIPGAGQQIFAQAYLGSFDPAHPCTNYLADPGASAALGGLSSFAFTAPAGATYVVVVNEVTAGSGGIYNLKVMDGQGVGYGFYNSASITINDNAVATPYPSSIDTSSVLNAAGGGAGHVSINIFGFSHTYPSDVGILLTSPGGVNSEAMLNSGAGTAASGVNLQFDDFAASTLPIPIISGIFKPTAPGTSITFPAPAPAGPYSANFANFIPYADAGVWNLYVLDHVPQDSGSISGGWSLELHQNTFPTVNTAASLNFTEGDHPKSVTLGTVSDAEWAAEELNVSAPSAPNFTVVNLKNTGGTVTANVGIACGTAGTHPFLALQARDQGYTVTNSINVNIAPNTPPALGTYTATTPIIYGGSATVSPSAAPTDNGTFTINANAESGFTGTVSVDPVTGNVSIANAAPVGAHTVTVLALDNCGLASSTTFTFHVNAIPPVITSAAMAGGTLNAPFSYELTATGTAPITYAVTGGSLPSGLMLNGNTITGYPSAIGQQTVTITGTNPGGTSVLGLTIDVGTIGDSDGDGYPDALEVALGSDPNNFESTPLGGSPGAVPNALQISKLSVSLNFAKGHLDSAALSGVLPVAAGFNVNGQVVGLEIGGFAEKFVLNAKGVSPKANDIFAVKVVAKKGVVEAQGAKFALKLSKESLAALLAPSGLTNANATKVPVSVKVIVFFGGQLYLDDKSLTYTAKLNKTGAAR